MSVTAIPLAALLAPLQPWQPDSSAEIDYYDMAGFKQAEPLVRSGNAVPADAHCVHPGDVLVSIRSRTPRRAWIVGAARGRAQVAAPHWLVLRSDSLDPGYARQVFVSNEFELVCRRLAPSRARRRSSIPPGLAAITIALPARDAQRRAAHVLDRVDTLRGRRAAVTARAYRLEQALFGVQFAEDARTAASSPRLSSLLCGPPQRGTAVPLATQGRFAVIRATDLRHGEVTLSDARYVSHSDCALTRTTLIEGDVLLAREPGRPEIRVAVARPGSAIWFTHATVWRLRADTRQVSPEYLRAWLSSPPGRRVIAGAWSPHASAASVARRLAAIAVPLPAPDDQQRFAERARAAERLLARLHASASRLDALLGTLRDLAFRVGLDPD